jgi:hypothetical protein
MHSLCVLGINTASIFEIAFCLWWIAKPELKMACTVGQTNRKQAPSNQSQPTTALTILVIVYNCVADLHSFTFSEHSIRILRIQAGKSIEQTWSFMAQLVEHGSCNARTVGLFPRSTHM